MPAAAVILREGTRSVPDGGGEVVLRGLGPADEAVQALLAGTLAYDPDTVCAHHHSGHEEGHTCAHGGENGCQHGSCGA